MFSADNGKDAKHTLPHITFATHRKRQHKFWLRTDISNEICLGCYDLKLFYCSNEEDKTEVVGGF